MMGNSSLAFSIGSFLFGLLLAGAYYLRLKHWSLPFVISVGAVGVIVIILASKPLADTWKTPAIRKTIILANINSGDWEGTKKGEKIILPHRKPARRPILRSQFVKDKPYPLDLEISHAGRMVSMSGGYLTLRFKETVKMQFSEEQREWRPQNSEKTGWIEYKNGFSSIYRDAPRRMWPVPHFVFPQPGQYRFEYEIDTSGQDYNGQAFDIGLLTGTFFIELHE